jgi:flagellar biogenesis protein FliO
MTVGSSLAIVLGLFFLLAWLTRRGGAAVAPQLPTEVVEVLGRSALSGRQQLNLVRLGRRLLLLSITTTGAETLAEITEPEEVDRIMDLVEGSQIGGASATLRGVLSRFH